MRYLERHVEGPDWVIVARMAFGWRLQMTDGFNCWDGYCYSLMEDCMQDFLSWNGEGDPPGRWHKRLKDGKRRPEYLIHGREASGESE